MSEADEDAWLHPATVEETNGSHRASKKRRPKGC